MYTLHELDTPAEFDWITAECPKLASKLRLTNTDIIKCQQLMYNDGGYISG